MKKITAILLIAIFALTAASCGNNNASLSDSSAGRSVGEKVTDTASATETTTLKVTETEAATEFQTEKVTETEVAQETASNEDDDRYAKLISDFKPSSLNTYRLTVGDTHKPTAAVWVEGGNGEVYSSDESVVTVSAYGKVTAVGAGEAYVIITSGVGMSDTYLYKVTGGTEDDSSGYKELIDNFVPSALNTLNLKVGDSQTATAAVWLQNGGGKVYSSDESVVTVSDKGVITAVGAGEAYVVIVASVGSSMNQVYLCTVTG